MTVRRVLLFVRVFVVVAFASAFLLAVVTTAQNNHRLTAQNDRLIAQIEREHAEAATERQSLIAGQRDLQHKYDGLLAQQKALLVWLRTHGIVVPADLIADANADSSTVHSDGGGSSSGGSSSSAPQNNPAAPNQTKKANPPSAHGGQSPAHHGSKGHGSKGGHSKGGGAGKGSGHSKGGHSKGHSSK